MGCNGAEKEERGNYGVAIGAGICTHSFGLIVYDLLFFPLLSSTLVRYLHPSLVLSKQAKETHLMRDDDRVRDYCNVSVLNSLRFFYCIEDIERAILQREVLPLHVAT